MSRHTYGSTTPPTRLHSLLREKVRRRSCYSEIFGNPWGTGIIESAMARPDPLQLRGQPEPPHLWLDDAPDAPAL